MVDPGNTNITGGRWVCPNDRHLALRAKLRTGWSVKTGSLDYRNDQSSGSQLALTEEERLTIIEVIRRAEALDISEQERVGRLVDRLENMKRNCVSSGNLAGDHGCSRYACALCGEKFTVLGASPAICKDCRRNICQKCGIDATMTSYGSQQIVPPQTGQRPKLFLCRICSETREMWKKSGAWFFKGLPKYVLPEKKADRGRSRRSSRASTWAVVNNLRSLDSNEPDSSLEDDACRRLAMNRSFTGHSEAPAPSMPSTEDKYRSATPIFASRDAYGREHSIVSGDLNNGTRSADTDNASGQFSTSGTVPPLQSPRYNVIGRSSGSFQSQILADHRHPSSDQLNCNQVHSLRRDSLDSGSNQGFLTLDHHLDHNQYHEPDLQSLVTGNEGHNNHSRILTAPAPGDGYGTLEVSLLYDPAAQYLQCRVLRARGLRPMDIHGLTDSFCKLNILPITIGGPSQRLRTKTVHKTRDPEYHETVTFYGITETSMKNGKALHILVLQDDSAGKDFLGEAKLPLCHLQPYQTIHYSVFLENRFQVDNEEEVWGEDVSPRGRILVTLNYSTRRRALLVNVSRAVNLLPMDNNGFSDPFVKLYLIKRPDDNSQHQGGTPSVVHETKKKDAKKPFSAVYSTGVKWKTLNPEWNEEFAFETRLMDLASLMLCLSVWDKDFGKSNDYLGGLVLSCSSKGERLRQWIDAIKFPDHHHQAWHNLQKDPIPIE